VLKCLDRGWQPKVTTISKAKDLSTMTIVSLFGKFKEELNNKVLRCGRSLGLGSIIDELKSTQLIVEKIESTNC